MAKAKTTPAAAEREPGDDTEGTTATTTAPAATADTVDADARIIPHKASAVTSVADVGELMEADAADGVGHGFEKQDVAIPFFRVLQSNSPQVKRQNPAYIEGAEEGSFFNTVTQAVFNGQKGVDFVPVVFQRQATLWWPRDKGGPNGEKGFVRELPVSDAEKLLKTNTEKNEKGKDVVKEGPHQGQELVFAAMYYGFVVTGEGSFEPVAFPFTSTQLKKARMWNALIVGARLPNSSGVGSYNPKMYGFVYHLTTLPESNAKGEWMGVKISKGPPVLQYENGSPVEKYPGGAQLYLAAREFETLMASGRVKVKHEDMVGGEETAAANGADGEGDEDLPF